MRTAAFFDFDNTLLTTDSAEVGIRYMYKYGYLTTGYVLKVWLTSKIYNRHWLSSERMAEICMSFYRGRQLEEFSSGAEMFYDDYLKPCLNPEILARVEEHRAQGHVLVILSASVRYMLEPARRQLGFDHLLCTDLELDEAGLLTGRPVGGGQMMGDYKARAMKDLAEREGVDLAASYAYSDHQSDVPMLESVGHPVVVRPTHPLAKVAEKRGWPIIGERGKC